MAIRVLWLLGAAALMMEHSSAQDVVHGFEARRLQREYRPDLAYRLRPPTFEGQRGAHPLLIFLHGAGERGDDNLAQLSHLPERLAHGDWRDCFDGFVLAPQCDQDRRWVESSWSDLPPPAMHPEPSENLQEVIELVEHLLATESIDRSRVTLTGLSMGGQGAWELAVRRPHWFAAMAPVCGGADPTQVQVLESLPVFAWHGVDDGAVPFERSRLMVEALRAVGGSARFEALPVGTGHAAWDKAYRARSPLWPWLRDARRSTGRILLASTVDVRAQGGGSHWMGDGAEIVVADALGGGARLGADLDLEGRVHLRTDRAAGPSGSAASRAGLTLAGELRGGGSLVLADGELQAVLTGKVSSDWTGGVILAGGSLQLGGAAADAGLRLSIEADSALTLNSGPVSARIEPVKGSLQIHGWEPQHRLRADHGALGSIRFINPAGLPAGEHAAVLRNGLLAPD